MQPFNTKQEIYFLFGRLLGEKGTAGIRINTLYECTLFHGVRGDLCFKEKFNFTIRSRTPENA